MALFKRVRKIEETKPYSVGTPVRGTVIDIKDTKDQLFSSEALGKGVGITPLSNEIIAPIGGTISTFFPTKHAIGITTDQGVDILIHVGIDTVELNGKHFTPLKKQGDSINRGDPLLLVDFKEIEKAGYDTTVMLVITNTAQYKEVKSNLGDKEVGEIVIEIV